MNDAVIRIENLSKSYQTSAGMFPALKLTSIVCGQTKKMCREGY